MPRSIKLHPRFLVSRIKEALADTPVVCLLGPRQVGKTTLAQQLIPKRSYINFDDATLVHAAKRDPTGFIAGLPGQVTLDEIQRVPELLPAIKANVDQHRIPGRFLLTGSANLLVLPGVQESLAGRVEVIYLQPLSEGEKQHGKKHLLTQLLDNSLKPSIHSEQTVIAGVAEAVCSGGYPEPNTRSGSRARQWYQQYLQAIIQRDVRDIANIRDEADLQRIIEILAHRTAKLLNVSALATELGIRRETVERYITILERLFLIRRLPAWHNNQAKRIVKTPKIHMIDTGLATTMNGLSKTDWNDFSTDFGPLLESFVVQQLICQAGWIDSDLRFSHYRDKDKVEVDLVIEQGKKLWGVEVKKAASLQSTDGAGLQRLAAQAGKKFSGGMLLYTGNNCLPLAQNNCLAVPMNYLWR